MEFEQLIETRRSIRHYTGEKIDHASLVKILEQAQKAPSWKNLQPCRFYIAESEEALGQLRTKGLPEFNQKNSANATLIVTTFVKRVVGHDPQGNPANELGDMWGAYDLGLHDAYLVLAAANAGYDTLIMGIRDSAAIRSILEIPEEEAIVSVIAIGKKEGEAPSPAKKEVAEIAVFY